jgi:deferrochelatase/peroxidase EfeB
MTVSRRDLLSAAGLVAIGAGTDRLVGSPEGRPERTGGQTIPFFAAHQPGIATPTQQHLQFGAFDVLSPSIQDLRQLLTRWSTASAALAEGHPIGAIETGAAPPADTGEALGLGPSRLTVTIGFGPRLFDAQRFGLETRRPAPLVDLPAFPGDALLPQLCGGDLAVQVCSEDPVVAFHGLHVLARMANPIAVARWTLAGFGRTSNSRRQQTPRNLMGFKDGTANVMSEDIEALDKHVWARPPASPTWMAGGTYMVVRRIRMLLGGWDATGLKDQELVFGRRKLSGAPLGGSNERDALDLGARLAGVPVIPPTAHVRLASPAYNRGQRLLRRGYSFVDGIDKATETMAGGLLFICFQRDPRGQFIPIQRRLANSDALNQHTEHVGSAIFACPPGASRRGFLGDRLFA